MTETVRERVARIRAAKGLPPTIKDPAVLDRAADIMRLAGDVPVVTPDVAA